MDALPVKSTSLSPGQLFGRLTTIQPSHLAGKWQCRCACGLVVHVFQNNLLYGNSKSCGSKWCRSKPAAGQHFIVSKAGAKFART